MLRAVRGAAIQPLLGMLRAVRHLPQLQARVPTQHDLNGNAYSKRPFIRSGDTRSEPPCLWEFKISKEPYPPS